jgi:hypothetical protein
LASQRQIDFFDQLTTDRQFPPEAGDLMQLKIKFANLSQDAASKWIENALALPKLDSDAGDNTPPPF